MELREWYRTLGGFGRHGDGMCCVLVAVVGGGQKSQWWFSRKSKLRVLVKRARERYPKLS